MSHHTTQPSSGPHMTMTPATEAFIKGAAKQGGKEAAKYEQEHGQEQLQDAQQQLDNAKAQAQGLWAKYCGCLSGAV